jgi:hypothetical protein
MSDVFTRTELNFGGAFTADRGLITGTDALNGVLMQNLQASYAQQVTRIYELGTSKAVPNMYYIGGRSQGSLGIAHVVGLAAIMQAFYAKYGDVCQAATNAIQINVANGDESPCTDVLINYTAKYCVLTQIGLSVGAQDMVINKNNQLMFSNLEYNEGG